MAHLLKYIFALTLVVTSSTLSQAGKLEDLENLHQKNTLKLAELKASGLGHSHPRVRLIEKTLEKLDLEILNTKELRREIIIMIDGTKSLYLAGHARHGKTDTALTELLNAGWEIQQIIPAGTTKELPKNQQEANLMKAAYVWLSFEG